MKYLGDFAEDATVQVYFTTHDALGGAVAPSSAFEAADVKIYKDGSDSEKTAVDGLTMTSPFDSITGLHRLTIDTSNDTNDAGFWVTGSDYTVILSPDETVDGETVVAVVATFSIENRFMRGTDSAATSSALSTHDGKLDTLTTTVGVGNWALVTTVDARQSTTLFTMAVGVNANNAYNGMLVMVQDADDSHYEVRRVRDYIGSSKQIQLDTAFGFDVANGDDVRLLSTGYTNVHLYEMAGSIDAVTNMRKQYLGTGYGAVLIHAAIASITSQTVFVLNTVSSVVPSTDDDAYNGCIIVFENPGDDAQKSVGLIADYDGSSQTITLESAPAFTIAGSTLVTILAGTQNVPISEITGVSDIPVTPTVREALMLLYMWLRNDSTDTATERRIKNNAGSEVLDAPMDDDGSRFSQGQLGAP